MRTQIKVIRFAAINSAIFAVFTYLITLNMEIGFLNLDTPWLSNNFALTICGGVFVSLLVMLICEVQKYLLDKKNAEDFLYFHTAYIFAQLHVIKTHLLTCIEDSSRPVPKELLTYTVGIIKNEIALVSNVDYITLTSCQLVKSYQDFCINVLKRIEYYLNTTNYLSIAVLQDQICNLQIFGVERTITAQSPNTGKVLHLLCKDIDPLSNEVDTFLLVLDFECKNRYEWRFRRDAMLENWNATPYSGFEDYIKQK